MPRLECSVINCPRPPIWEEEDDVLCERHMPDPHVRSWGEMKAEGVEIETMQEYVDEVRGFNDDSMYDEPADAYDDYFNG